MGQGFKKAGYATDPKYPDKLISIIERYQLQEYDREVLKGKKREKKKKRERKEKKKKRIERRKKKKKKEKRKEEKRKV